MQELSFSPFGASQGTHAHTHTHTHTHTRTLEGTHARVGAGCLSRPARVQGVAGWQRFTGRAFFRARVRACVHVAVRRWLRMGVSQASAPASTAALPPPYRLPYCLPYRCECLCTLMPMSEGRSALLPTHASCPLMPVSEGRSALLPSQIQGRQASGTKPKFVAASSPFALHTQLRGGWRLSRRDGRQGGAQRRRRDADAAHRSVHARSGCALQAVPRRRCSRHDPPARE